MSLRHIIRGPFILLQIFMQVFFVLWISSSMFHLGRVDWILEM